jgi:hypothetical protein
MTSRWPWPKTSALAATASSPALAPGSMVPFDPSKNYVLKPGTSPSTFSPGFYVIQQLHFATNNASNWQDSYSPGDAMRSYSGTLYLPKALQYVNSPYLNPNIVPQLNLPGPNSNSNINVPLNDSTFFNGFNLQPGTYELSVTHEWWTTSPAPVNTPLRLSVIANVYAGNSSATTQIKNSQATAVATERDLVEPWPVTGRWFTDSRVTTTLVATFIVSDFSAPDTCLLWFMPLIVGSPSLISENQPYIQVGVRNFMLRQIGSNSPGLDATPGTA